MPRRFSDGETMSRRLKIARLYHLGGLTQEQIAAECGVTHQQVSDDLRYVREFWREQLGDKLGDLKAEILGVLDMVIDQAKLGWRLSLKPTKKNFAKTKRAAPTRKDGK